MEKIELVVQALQERIGQIVSQYETHVAVLRAEITEMQEKQKNDFIESNTESKEK